METWQGCPALQPVHECVRNTQQLLLHHNFPLSSRGIGETAHTMPRRLNRLLRQAPIAQQVSTVTTSKFKICKQQLMCQMTTDSSYYQQEAQTPSLPAQD
jgi:hypothetical protein